MEMNYNHLYKKYKAKYLALKNELQTGGANRKAPCKGKPHNRETKYPPYEAEQCKDKLLRGNDGKFYLSVQDKAAKYVWKFIKRMNNTKTPEEYFEQFPNIQLKYDVKPTVDNLKLVKRDLEKENIFLIPIGWLAVWDSVEFLWEDTLTLLEDNSKVHEILNINLQKKEDIFNIRKNILENISFLMYSDYYIFEAKISGELFIQFNIIKKDKDKVIDTFKKYFGKKFQWSGNLVDPMIINITAL